MVNFIAESFDFIPFSYTIRQAEKEALALQVLLALPV